MLESPKNVFDPEEIRAAERWLKAALEDVDATKRVFCYTEDAVFVFAGSPALEGREMFLQHAAANTPLRSVEIAPLATEGNSLLASVYGHASWSNGPDAPAGSERTTMRYLMVWRKESDGQWRIAREFLNPEQAR